MTTTYVCPKCGYRYSTDVRLLEPPTCCNQKRHTTVAMRPEAQQQQLLDA